MAIHPESKNQNMYNIKKLILLSLFPTCLFACKSKKIKEDVPRQSFLFESRNVNLSTLKKIVLIQYPKNSKFNCRLRIDTFEVQPIFEKIRTNRAKLEYWEISIYNPYNDTAWNLFNYDYDLEFVNFPKAKIRYSDIIVKQQKVYGGYFSYIDSFTYNGKAVKNTFSSRALGIW